MRRTLKILDQDQFPITVLDPLDCDDPELLSWERFFSERDIRTRRKNSSNPNKVLLCREVTERERGEIERRELIIRGGSLRIANINIVGRWRKVDPHLLEIYLAQGHTQTEAAEYFRVDISTISRAYGKLRARKETRAVR